MSKWWLWYGQHTIQYSFDGVGNVTISFSCDGWGSYCFGKMTGEATYTIEGDVLTILIVKEQLLLHLMMQQIQQNWLVKQQLLHQMMVTILR